MDQICGLYFKDHCSIASPGKFLTTVQETP